YKGSPQKLARRRDLWRSVIMQQLQADVFAVQMSSQLLNATPHPEAKLYYSTMVQDESRHTEAWLKLAHEAGGEAERDPHLVKIANRMLPIFVDHSLWRPKARASIAGLMRDRDIKMLQDDLEQGVRLAGSLGIDVSDLELPSFS